MTQCFYAIEYTSHPAKGQSGVPAKPLNDGQVVTVHRFTNRDERGAWVRTYPRPHHRIEATTQTPIVRRALKLAKEGAAWPVITN